MAVGIEAIDRLKLAEAFAQGTFRPFNECWTVRMDRELLVVDDDIEKNSRFSDDLEESKAMKQEFQLAFAEEVGYALDFSEKTYWEKI